MADQAFPTSLPNSIRGQIIQDSPTKLTPPKNIIQSVQAAKTIYYQYRGEHLKRIELCAAIEGLFAGNPPYDPAELAKSKLDFISNFNNLDARSIYERAALAYWNLLNEAETLINFDVKLPDPQAKEWAQKMSRYWDEVVRMWPSFNVVFNTLVAQIVKFGVSPIVWSDERDWRWRTVEYTRFFVQDQAQSDIEQVTAICVETVFTSQYLYEVYEQIKDEPETDSKKYPWCKEELCSLLVWLANQSIKDNDRQYYDMMEIQRRIQNEDLSFNAIYSDNIRLVSLFYQEYDGKISHYMFHPYYDQGRFLFFADRQYERMEEGLIIFTASPGEFTIHSNRGLGHKIFAGSQAMMQLDCSIVDMAKMSATPLIKTLATGAKDFEKIRFYPGVPTNIGTCEVEENTLGENVSQLVQTNQYILGKLEFNAANSGDNPAMPDKDQGSMSPSQARAKDFKEFGVLKNNIAHFYSQFDRVLRNMVRKMLSSKHGYPGHEYVKMWKDKCLADGVPEQAFANTKLNMFGLPTHLTVSATRVAGSGSNLARIMGLQEVSPLVPGLGPKGQRFYQKEYITATLGKEYAEPLLQDASDPTETSNGASVAGVENAVMRLGESPVFSPSDSQQTHFVVHMSLGNNTIQRIQQQQINAIAADKIFTVLIPHMQEHWTFIAKNPFMAPFVEQHRKAWDQLGDYARLNRKNAESQLEAELKKQQEQAKKTRQVLTDEELKNLKTTADIARADRKVEAQIERGKEANDTRADIMRDKVTEDANIGRMKVGLDHQVKTLAEQNKAVEETPTEDLREQLANMAGNTPSPSDIEMPV